MLWALRTTADFACEVGVLKLGMYVVDLCDEMLWEGGYIAYIYEPSRSAPISSTIDRPSVRFHPNEHLCIEQLRTLTHTTTPFPHDDAFVNTNPTLQSVSLNTS
jgi:hypothetical protein